MKTVFRYSIFPRGDSHAQILKMRRGANIIAASAHSGGQEQGEIALHAIVDDRQPAIDREIYVIETGKEIPTDVQLRYVATVRLLNDRYVVHIFAVPEGPSYFGAKEPE